MVTGESRMNESVIDVCDCCGGDGGFSEPWELCSWGVSERWVECTHCDGEGFVLVAAEQADEEWITEEAN